jgi:hypothetical protein
MANVNHATLTDPFLHEPKGIAAATADRVYIANGSGSGVWTPLARYVNGYVGFDATTPAYQKSVTTAFTALNPTFLISANNGFTGLSSPNARLRYDGAETITAFVQFTISYIMPLVLTEMLRLKFSRMVHPSMVPTQSLPLRMVTGLQ